MSINKSHGKNKDKYLDRNGTNEVSAANAKDAVDKKHVKNADTILNEGGANEISADYLDAALRTIPHVYETEDLRLLLHFDGTDGATSTVDDSSFNNTLTFQGSSQLDTADKKFGTTSLFLNGTTDYLDLNVGTNIQPFLDSEAKWTIDAWFKLKTPVVASEQQIIGTIDRIWYLSIDYSSGSLITLRFKGAGATQGSNGHTVVVPLVQIADGQWHHIAVALNPTGTGANNNNFFSAIYLDGQFQNNNSMDGTFASSANLTIGKFNNTDYFNGWIDEIRINRGDTFGIMKPNPTTSFVAFEADFILPEVPHDPVVHVPQLASISTDRRLLRSEGVKVSDVQKLLNIPSGINQAAAGAGPGELWADTSDGNTVKLGV